MQRKIAIGVSVSLIVIAVILLWLARTPEETVTATPVAATTAAPQGLPSPQEVASAIEKSKTDTRFKTGRESMPKSLMDTEVDGALEVDKNGNLIISQSIRQTFDYFLSAIGEEDLTTIVARIRAYIRHKLANYPQAAQQAEQILDGYLSYRDSLGRLPQIQGDPAKNMAAIRQQKEQIASLRTQFLSREVIQAFFGDEDAYDRYTMARIEVMQDKNLSAAEKAKRTAELLNTLPPQLKESVQTLNKYQELTTFTEDWKARGGKPEELRAIREQVVGVEATERLEALDKERAEWDTRINSYLQTRDGILKNPALSDAQRQQQLNDIKNKQFNEQERVRVGAFET
ncbi:MAG: lipase secretion chaperone, partial [Pseudomonadales bacterium]|nr:lipase secretion chaperone [Pseudomonadales bacterium]